MSLVAEITIGSVIVVGILGKYLKTKYDQHVLKKQYPKTLTTTAKKFEYMTLHHLPHEQILFVSAKYGDYDIMDWITQSMDSNFLQFSVDDDTLQTNPTKDDSELSVCYVLRYIGD
jgi:hypothetical protein